MELLREAESLAERLGDEDAIGKDLLSLSIGLWMMGHSDGAQDLDARALAIAESTDDGLLRHPGKRPAALASTTTGATIGRPPPRSARS